MQNTGRLKKYTMLLTILYSIDQIVSEDIERSNLNLYTRAAKWNTTPK